MRNTGRIFLLTGFFFWNMVALLHCEGPPKPDLLPVPQEAPQKTPEDLMKALESDLWSDRSQAVAEISIIHHKPAIPKLRKLLNKDPHPAVRGTSAIALGEMQDFESTQAIGEKLQKDKEVSSDIIIDALARMKDSRGAKYILPFLDSENDMYRLQVVEALVLMKAKQAGSNILSLAVKNKDSEKAKTFAMALGHLEYFPAENYLQSIAKTYESSPTVAASILALGKIKSKNSVNLLVEFFAKDFPKGKENAAEALISIGDRSAAPKLYKFLGNPDRETRYTVGSVIATIPAVDTAPAVLGILQKKEINSIGVSCFILGRLKYEPGRKYIETQLSDAKSPEREEIAKSLGWIGNKESVPLLIKVLEEKDGEGRYGSAWSLGILEAREALPALLKAMESPDRKLSAISMESIGMLKAPEAVPALVKRVKADGNLMAFAAGSLSSIPGIEARKALEEFAIHKDPVYFKPALQAIGQRKDKDSVPLLIELLSENSERTKLAKLALINITGEKFQTKNEWINWHKTTQKK